MRPTPNDALERIRHVEWEVGLTGTTARGTNNGCFLALYNGAALRIIAGHGEEWEHVSVSLAKRTPNWREMSYVKTLFWLPEEAVMQLHPPESTWVNNHPNVLHLWRPMTQVIPLPPPIMVGVKEVGEIRDRAHAAEVRRKYML